ncbi:hypothetical protein B296_00026006 [Ensete ventricosum]|uniref:Uncharacterized protein n=1 Tax=Ensete ventricosum TaxID=4639 RepID=A0A426YYS7_ENSVE|nr:hypothetical protein B296_00026006 [Ensete ventricosum]
MAMTSSIAGATGHLQGGGRLQPRPPYKGATGCGQTPCKGWPPAVAGQLPVASGRLQMPVGRPRGATPRPGLPLARAIAGRSGRQPTKYCPKVAAPTVGATAHTDGV